LRQVTEFEVCAAVAGPAEELASCFIGVKDGQIAADDQASAAEFAQDVPHHFVVGGELIVQPDVLHAHAQFFEEMKDEFEFSIGNGLAGDPPVEGRHAQ
jgi:hypothetical protein